MNKPNATAPLILNPADNIGIILQKVSEGDVLAGLGITADERVPSGHKIAIHDIADSDPIRKFGQVIGYANGTIAKGAHVHVHNCDFGAHDQTYEIGVDLDAARAAVPTLASRTFQGYRRADGGVGTRNMIALCATVNCSATVIRQAADQVMRSGILDQYPNVDGIAAFAHGSGCGMANHGRGWEYLQRVLWGHATHPNIGAAIFVGLGCEVMQIAKMRSMFDGDGDERFHGLTIQDTGGTTATIAQIVRQVEELLPLVNQTQREACSMTGLTVGLQCGGSDGFSGITANPALGIAADMLVGLGGTVVLAETSEIYGAEQLLLRRAASDAVAQKLIDQVRWWEDYAALHGGSLDNNPSPGNKAGGLTTILEKSLGAAAKAGSTPLNDVYGYAEKVTSKGFVFMDTPGYDPVSVTGQIAGGCQLIVFTTGRGSAFGSKPAPTLKVATNDRLFKAMPDDMDINCGDIIGQGVSLADKGAEILDAIIAAASGKPTKSEALGLGDHEFVPWQIGAVM